MVFKIIKNTKKLNLLTVSILSCINTSTSNSIASPSNIEIFINNNEVRDGQTIKVPAYSDIHFIIFYPQYPGNKTKSSQIEIDFTGNGKTQIFKSSPVSYYTSYKPGKYLTKVKAGNNEKEISISAQTKPNLNLEKIISNIAWPLTTIGIVFFLLNSKEIKRLDLLQKYFVV